jgi:hypothetical protein
MLRKTRCWLRWTVPDEGDNFAVVYEDQDIFSYPHKENVSDSMHINSESVSNEMDEREWKSEK